ncbi:uncharacterized protein METZ01_LOCUS480853, partial [marine metagenome]
RDGSQQWNEGPCHDQTAAARSRYGVLFDHADCDRATM